MAFRPLHPFAQEAHLRDFSLVCGARRQPGGHLELHFRLSGPLQTLQIPPLSGTPERRDDLWRTTCFEAFLGQPGQASYWELNLAPSGDWNLYAFEGYRAGMQPERRLQQLPFQLDRQWLDPSTPSTANGPNHPGRLSRLDLVLNLDLAALMPPEAPLELSATAVLEHQVDHQSGSCSYWAWQHRGLEADFHRRDSFQPL